MTRPAIRPLVHWRFQAAGRPGVPPLDAAEGWLAPPEVERLRTIRVDKRRQDWLLGRLNLKALLVAIVEERYGTHLLPSAILVDRHLSGAPFIRLVAREAGLGSNVAPGVLPVTVSNTHSHGHAFCAAAWVDGAGGALDPVPGLVRPGFALGVDLEWVEPRSEGFVQDFLTDAERQFCTAVSARERDVRVNLVWSAKEAVLKVLQRGLTVDTWWLTCLPAPSPDGESLARAMVPADQAWRPFLVTWDARLPVPEGLRFAGAWREIDGFVATVATGWR